MTFKKTEAPVLGRESGGFSKRQGNASHWLPGKMKGWVPCPSLEVDGFLISFLGKTWQIGSSG